MAVVGYSLSGQDNDSYMYRTWKAASRCPVCRTVLDHRALNPDFRLKLDIHDVSYTYDGACVVSESAMRALSPFAGVEATRLPFDRDFYLLNVANAVEFDSERRKTRFQDFCDGCNRFRSVAGATPAFLRRTSEPLAEGIYRTDVEFGTDDERAPLLIVSTGLRDVLTRQAPKGLTFRPVEG